MREDHDAGDELESLRAPGEIGEHHERIVERIALGVWTYERWFPVGVHGTQHVVVGENVVEAELLGGGSEAAYGLRIAVQLDLGIDDAELHESQSAVRLGW